MKRFMILATAAFLSTAAFAQTATVEIAPEQRTKIKQYVTTQKVAPVTVKEKSHRRRDASGGRALAAGSGRLGPERNEVPLHLRGRPGRSG